MASLSTNFKHILFHMAGVSTKKGICRYIVHGYYIFGSLKIVAGLMLAPKSECLDKTFQIFFSKMLPLNKKNSWFVELGLFGALISASAMLLLTYTYFSILK